MQTAHRHRDVETAGYRGRKRNCENCVNAGRAAFLPVKLHAPLAAELQECRACQGSPVGTCRPAHARAQTLSSLDHSRHFLDAIPDRLRPRKHHSNREQPRYPTWVIAASPYVEDPALDAAIPVPQRRTLLELSGQTCRWPVGDPAFPDFFFCGGATHDAHPYCRDHCARAYQPPYSPA